MVVVVSWTIPNCTHTTSRETLFYARKEQNSTAPFLVFFALGVHAPRPNLRQFTLWRGASALRPFTLSPRTQDDSKSTAPFLLFFSDFSPSIWRTIPPIFTSFAMLDGIVNTNYAEAGCCSRNNDKYFLRVFAL